MADWWSDATELLKILVNQAAGQDKDGMDLSFCNGEVRLRSKKSPGDFAKAMENPNAFPAIGVHTDPRKILGDILKDYRAGPKNFLGQSKERKNLTIIFLTDGLWEGMKNKDELEQQIIRFTKQLMELPNGVQDRPVSIEFVQFGHDEDAVTRLKYLDDAAEKRKWDGFP